MYLISLANCENQINYFSVSTVLVIYLKLKQDVIVKT